MKSTAFFQCWDNYVPTIITCGGLCGVFIKSLDPGVRPQFRQVNLLLPNNIELENLTVLADELPDTDCLIGMDVINLCDFAITHKDKKTKFSFQIPASADIQF